MKTHRIIILNLSLIGAIIFLLFCSVSASNIIVTTEAKTFPFLAVEMDQNYLGEGFSVVVSAFSDVHPITLTVSAFSVKDNISYVVGHFIDDYFYLESLKMNTSSLSNQKEYLLTFLVKDFQGKSVFETYNVIIDTLAPIFESIKFSRNDFERRETITLDYEVVDINFHYVELLVQDEVKATYYNAKDSVVLSGEFFPLAVGLTTYNFDVEVRAVDQAGNSNSQRFFITYTNDRMDIDFWELNQQKLLITIGVIVIGNIALVVVVFYLSKVIFKHLFGSIRGEALR